MFELALLADISYRIYIFWLIIGFALSYVRKYCIQARYSTENSDQTVTDLPSAVENIRKRRKLRLRDNAALMKVYIENNPKVEKLLHQEDD